MIKWIPILFLLILITGCGSETHPLNLLNGEQTSQSTNPSPTIESTIESTSTIVSTSNANVTTPDTDSNPLPVGNVPADNPTQPTNTKSTSPQTDTSTTREETPEPTSANQSGPTEITEARPVCKMPSIYDYETGRCYRNPGSRNEEEQEELNRAEKSAKEDFPDDGGQSDDVPTNSGEQAG